MWIRVCKVQYMHTSVRYSNMWFAAMQMHKRLQTETNTRFRSIYDIIVNMQSILVWCFVCITSSTALASPSRCSNSAYIHTYVYIVVV